MPMPSLCPTVALLTAALLAGCGKPELPPRQGLPRITVQNPGQENLRAAIHIGLIDPPLSFREIEAVFDRRFAPGVRFTSDQGVAMITYRALLPDGSGLDPTDLVRVSERAASRGQGDYAIALRGRLISRQPCLTMSDLQADLQSRPEISVSNEVWLWPAMRFRLRSQQSRKEIVIFAVVESGCILSMEVQFEAR